MSSAREACTEDQVVRSHRSSSVILKSGVKEYNFVDLHVTSRTWRQPGIHVGSEEYFTVTSLGLRTGPLGPRISRSFCVPCHKRSGLRQSLVRRRGADKVSWEWRTEANNIPLQASVANHDQHSAPRLRPHTLSKISFSNAQSSRHWSMLQHMTCKRPSRLPTAPSAKDLSSSVKVTCGCRRQAS